MVEQDLPTVTTIYGNSQAEEKCIQQIKNTFSDKNDDEDLNDPDFNCELLESSDSAVQEKCVVNYNFELYCDDGNDVNLESRVAQNVSVVLANEPQVASVEIQVGSKFNFIDLITNDAQLSTTTGL